MDDLVYALAIHVQYAFQGRVFFRLLCVQPLHENGTTLHQNSTDDYSFLSTPSYDLASRQPSTIPYNDEYRILLLFLEA